MSVCGGGQVWLLNEVSHEALWKMVIFPFKRSSLSPYSNYLKKKKKRAFVDSKIGKIKVWLLSGGVVNDNED